MKIIQSRTGENFANSRANDPKLELVQEAIDVLYRNAGGKRSASNPGRHLSKFAFLSIAALCGPLLVGTSSAADGSTTANLSVANTNAPATSFDGVTNATKAAVAPATLQKPAWLTDLSIGVKESYDDNVFYGTKIPAGTAYVPVTGSTEALKDHWSWITTVSPKLGFNLVPALSNGSTNTPVIQQLLFNYSPDFVTYHNANSESYNNHRIGTTIKGKDDAFSFNLDNIFNYIDGDKYGAVYPGSYLNAYSTGTIRERRQQFQDRSKIVFQYDWEKWFIRPNATLLYYDLLTKQINSAGYQNYADRYDVNGGADVGYKVQKDLALTVGYRYGHQYQEKYPFITTPAQYSSSSDYNRVLFGIEGKPAKWLTVSAQAGPDFRNYADDAQVKDRDLTTYYGEAAVTVTPTTKDTIAFKYKQWQWVSSTGKIPYFDSLYDLSYARKLTDALSLTLGGRLVESDYTSANNPNGPAGTAGATIGNRDDVQYTIFTGLRYAFNANFSADLGYSYDLGRNVQDDLSTIQQDARKYDHQLVSLGVTVKF